MYPSPVEPVGYAACNAPKVEKEPRTRIPEPEGPVGPTGPIGPRGIGGSSVESATGDALLSSTLRSSAVFPLGIKTKNLCGFTPYNLTFTSYAQPTGERFGLFVVGRVTEKAPLLFSVAIIAPGIMTALFRSTTVAVGVKVTLPRAGTPRPVRYVPVTTRVTTSLP
jgi:hypothetical protein